MYADYQSLTASWIYGTTILLKL